jgi:exodeoxyribonuclease VII large subunit
MHDLLADIDRWPVGLQRFFDGDHRTVHTRAVSPGRREHDLPAAARRSYLARLVHPVSVGGQAGGRIGQQLARQRYYARGVALQSSPENPQPLRVIARAVRGWVERLGAVWVEAQLIEVNRRSGTRTIFLTLRDKLAEVSVSVTTSPTTLDSAGPLTEGATVVARIKPSYYESSGRFIYTCDAITPIGEGRLLARLEQTKRLLQAEGLFDRALKKSLPYLPSAVGLVTGEGSAAERDVMENARRRWPAVRIVTRYALVQGPQACEQLIAALQNLDRQPQVEVIIIARGGGSVEDLLPFSDEGLVRAVAACRTPVVSAIGHESDSPILDLVADYRASTPTDAAKRVVPDVAEERTRVQQARHRMIQAVSRLISRQQELLDGLRTRPVLTDPTATFGRRYEQLAELRHRANRAIGSTIDRESALVGHHLARIRAMSPEATLDRGYSILLGPNGVAVRAVDQVSVGDDLLAQLADGQLDVTVMQLRPRGGE